ncbi:MAG: hypothetical protein Q9170_001408 [Blastenia crenularia]
MTQVTTQEGFDASTRKPVPGIIDTIAAETPERPFLVISSNSDPRSGWRDITYGSFSQAVNRCAWWLKETLGESQDFETLTYVGPQDPTYPIFLLACVKTGYNALCCNPKTSLEDHIVLLKSSNCKVLFHPENPSPMVLSILQQRKIKDATLPQVDEWFKECPVPHFPFTKSLSEAWKDPFAIVHSSGTTGDPKLIQLTHSSVATAFRLQSTARDRPSIFHLWRGLRVLLAFPISIAAGIFCMLSINVEFGWIVVLPPPLPPSAELYDYVHRSTNAQVMATQPKIYADLVNNAEYLDNLRRLDYAAYSGGPCAPEVGARIAPTTRLVSLFGTSETGPIPTALTDADDWEYVEFSSTLPHRLDYVFADLYEFVVVREEAGENTGCSSTGRDRNLEPVFCTLPELGEHRTKDLYSKHPTKSSLWRYEGRRDDLITLESPLWQTSKILFPVPIEKALMAHPSIKSALVVGNGKPRPALLIEASEEYQHAAVEHESHAQEPIGSVVGPMLTGMNGDHLPHSRIDRDMIMVMAPGESMPTNSKGYVSRKLTTEKYQAVLDTLYASEHKSS